MNTAMRTRLQLAGGRDLDVFVSGPAHGDILLFHHGTPGSGWPIRTHVNAARRLGLRFVAASRPGYGDSTRQAGRSIVDVVSDSSAVLDAVGAERCFVAGWSGGGPHALACSARMPDRIAGVLIIAGVASYRAEGLNFMDGMGADNVVEFGKAIEGEAVLRPYVERERKHLLAATAEELVMVMSSLLPPVDSAVITAEFGEDLTAQMHEGLRVSADGWLDDDLAFVKPWGFGLSEVAVPTFLWQGSEDRMVPFAHGVWLADQIPGVVAHLEKGEGHVSISVGAIDRMLEELVAATSMEASE